MRPRRRRFTLALGLVLALLAAALLFPPSRYVLFGLLRREPFYRGRPASYWSAEIQAWKHRVDRPPRGIDYLADYLPFGVKSKPDVLAGGPAAVPVLVRLLHSEDVGVRGEAAAALGNLGLMGEAAIPELSTTLLEDADMRSRRRAALVLGRIGPPAKAPLLRALEDQDPLTRACAANALGSFGPASREAVPALAALLQDKHDYVRGEAAYALGCIGLDAKPAVPALTELLQDGEEWVRDEAVRALKRIQEGVDPGPPAP